MGQSLSSRKTFKESGAALILFIFLLVITVTTFFVTQLNNTAIHKIHEQQTADALAKAKAALIGYAIGDISRPGGLPCPDTNNDGTAEPSCSTSNLIGYFPWKTLGMEMLKDGNGECLWYALSPLFRSFISTRTASNNNQLKLDSQPKITLKKFNPSSPDINVIAVIISPGPPLAGQSRTAGSSTTCNHYPANGGYSDFLDTDQHINNATGNLAGSGYSTTLTFIQSFSTINNDQFQYITHKDLFFPLIQRVFLSAAGKANSPASGLYDYYNNYGTYPFAASSPSSPTSTPGDISDFFPSKNNLLIFNLNDWTFNTNDWKSDVHYEIGSNFINNSTGSIYQVNCVATNITCIQLHKGYRIPAMPAFLSVLYTDPAPPNKVYLLEFDI